MFFVLAVVQLLLIARHTQKRNSQKQQMLMQSKKLYQMVIILLYNSIEKLYEILYENLTLFHFGNKIFTFSLFPIGNSFIIFNFNCKWIDLKMKIWDLCVEEIQRVFNWSRALYHSVKISSRFVHFVLVESQSFRFYRKAKRYVDCEAIVHRVLMLLFFSL